MAKHDKDSLADALSRMGSGDALDKGDAATPGAAQAIPPQPRSAAEPAGSASSGHLHSGIESDLGSAVIDAPPRSAFAARQSTRDMLVQRQIDMKRTVIPILLTCGALLIVGGLLKWIDGSSWSFAAWDRRVAGALVACGIAVL